MASKCYEEGLWYMASNWPRHYQRTEPPWDWGRLPWYVVHKVGTFMLTIHTGSELEPVPPKRDWDNNGVTFHSTEISHTSGFESGTRVVAATVDK